MPSLASPSWETSKTDFIINPNATLLYFSPSTNRKINQWKNNLQQVNCKKYFCGAQLPDYEVTMIRPPIGNPDFQE